MSPRETAMAKLVAMLESVARTNSVADESPVAFALAHPGTAGLLNLGDLKALAGLPRTDSAVEPPVATVASRTPAEVASGLTGASGVGGVIDPAPGEPMFGGTLKPETPKPNG